MLMIWYIFDTTWTRNLESSWWHRWAGASRNWSADPLVLSQSMLFTLISLSLWFIYIYDMKFNINNKAKTQLPLFFGQLVQMRFGWDKNSCTLIKISLNYDHDSQAIAWTIDEWIQWRMSTTPCSGVLHVVISRIFCMSLIVTKDYCFWWCHYDFQ